MVADGVSLQRIRNYLSNWVTWWVRTSETWQYLELLNWYSAAWRDGISSSIARRLNDGRNFKDEARRHAAAAIIAG